MKNSKELKFRSTQGQCLTLRRVLSVAQAFLIVSIWVNSANAQIIDMPKLMKDLSNLEFTPAAEAKGQTRTELAHRKTGCVEDLMPNKSSAYYTEQLSVVRSDELKNSETYQDAWTYVKAAENSEAKIAEIYAASEKYNIPPLILYGSLAQESSLQEMGLSKDYFNWACGVGQLNINDWCSWANQTSTETKSQIEWPQQDFDRLHAQNPRLNLCGTFFIVPEYVRPFHQAAMLRLQSEMGPSAPEYMLEGNHVLSSVPSLAQSSSMLQTMSRYYFPHHANAEAEDAQKLRFEIGRSFAKHCAEHRNGIYAAAFTFKKVFDSLPEEIRSAQRYNSGEAKSPICKSEIKSEHFPIAIGWLLADAIYNAGPELLTGVMAYQKASHISWENFKPENLVDAINYTLKLPNNGLKPIGLREAIGHVSGVLEAIGAKESEDDEP